jgi:hypothetical protein
MKLSQWLDEKARANVDVSQIELPTEISYDLAPDETVFFEEINPCGVLCTKNHPYSKVERYGHWYFCKGQDKKAGIHSSKMKWRLFTKDKNLAIQTAKAHLYGNIH